MSNYEDDLSKMSIKEQSIYVETFVIESLEDKLKHCTSPDRADRLAHQLSGLYKKREERIRNESV